MDLSSDDGNYMINFCHDDAELHLDLLFKSKQLDKAAEKLVDIVKNDQFVSKHGKPKQQFWKELVELISKHPDKMNSLNVDTIIRDGLKHFPDQAGHSWNCLANYYLTNGLFKRACDIYEEAINSAMSVSDFSLIFNAYSLCLKANLHKRKLGCGSIREGILELKLYNVLLRRRPLLINRVLLHQNPHNVDLWLERVKLHRGTPNMIIPTYMEAIKKVNPELAGGKFYTLWVSFAKFYESRNEVEKAYEVFKKAMQVPFKEFEELESILLEFVEMYTRAGDEKDAVSLLKKAIETSSVCDQQVLPHSEHLKKSLRIWLVYVDLVKVTDSIESVAFVYDSMITEGISTPDVILSYGRFLEQQGRFGEALYVYAKGTSLFQWPDVEGIWKTYLMKSMEIFGTSSIHIKGRRKLFAQCLESCPKEFRKSIYLLFAKSEENYGSTMYALTVYEVATRAVPLNEKLEVFIIYMNKAAEIYGVLYVREIFQKAMNMLPYDQTKPLCFKFIEFELLYGEVDRVRNIYSYWSDTYCPKLNPDFWAAWKAFEDDYGNEDSKKRMNLAKIRAEQNENAKQVALKAADNLEDGIPNLEAELEHFELKGSEQAAENWMTNIHGQEVMEETETSSSPDAVFSSDSSPDELHC